MDLLLANPSRFRGLERERLIGWLRELVAALAPNASSLAVRFVADAEMERLNRTYRDRPGTTDVLSFPGEETLEGHHLGDIAISVPVARQQAARAGHSLRRELQILILHGLLHCLGYDHERDDGEMQRYEKRLRRRYVDG